MLKRTMMVGVLMMAAGQARAAEMTVSAAGPIKTVQAAIDAVPADNREPVTITIKPGTYKEKIVVPKNKPFITIKGEDPKTTVLTYDNNANDSDTNGVKFGTFNSYSVQVAAADFTAENVTFENTSGDRGQALALAAVGDRQVYRNCILLGWQDTLYCNSGRQLYEKCHLEGRVDFIFGNATAVFDRCTIVSRNGGHVTAASTDPNVPWGLVFLDCKLTGSPGSWAATTQPSLPAPKGPVLADLGRPWKPGAMTAFIRCELGEHIRPEGWMIWKSAPTNHLSARYFEYQCTGPGAVKAADRATSKRLDWTKEMPDEMAKDATREKILAGKDGWKP